MRRILVTLAVLIPLAIAGTALASPISLTFPPSPPAPIDITNGSWNSPQNIAVSYSVDLTSFPSASAFVTDVDVTGSTNGILRFDFPQTASSLTVGFTLSGFDPATVGFLAPVSILFQLDAGFAGFIFDPLTVPAGLSISDLVVSGPTDTGPFNNAQFSFTDLATTFDVTNLSYEPVPEPGSLFLVGTGFISLCGIGLFRRK